MWTRAAALGLAAAACLAACAREGQRGAARDPPGPPAGWELARDPPRPTPGTYFEHWPLLDLPDGGALEGAFEEPCPPPGAEPNAPPCGPRAWEVDALLRRGSPASGAVGLGDPEAQRPLRMLDRGRTRP